MVGMLRRAQEREVERDERLARLRSASAVLGEVAAELRMAARNAAAVTSEQSGAVAQTSATIQQLAATAGSIADTVRAVSQAADRAGDTMRGMQEKVQAISDRALSLSGRTQKIGEILELINEISGQQNLLALNAAIESARAGGSGRGCPMGGAGRPRRSRRACGKAPENSSMGTYTCLKVAGEAYAVPIGNVVEIASLGDLTAVPGSPRQILGVRNLRGQILPVIDFALLLGLNPAAPPRQLLVAEAGRVQAGFAVDDVSNVGELPDPNAGAESDVLLV